MKIEHIAFNVADPIGVADWYCKHRGFRVVRYLPEPSQTHFLADSDATVLEIYNNPADQVPDYQNMNPLLFHLALMSSDTDADSKRLIAEGAVFVDEVRTADGSHLVMLRDPWGMALQLCKRTRSLSITHKFDSDHDPQSYIGKSG
jgi:catechol 2,3-dioxygenase-like lactoylglutathione lyase family enzyme